METYFKKTLVVMGMLAMLTGCQTQSAPSENKAGKNKKEPKQKEAVMQLTSSAFKHGQPIPARFTCDGEDVSPALAWSNIPAATKSLALVCDDPAAPAGNWIHWMVVNIPVTAAGIPENGPLPEGALEIKNSFGKTAYGGPCPPSGTHRYFFKLYALDTPQLENVNLNNYKSVILRHTQDSVELLGTYQRK